MKLDQLLKERAHELQDMQENLQQFKDQMNKAASQKFPQRKDFNTDEEYLRKLEILAVE